MANITVAGNCSITSNGITSTLSASYTADVDRLVEISRDLDTTFQSINGTGNGLAFTFIANNGSTYIEWAVLPSTGGTQYVSGSIPPGGHALLPAFIATDGPGATSDLHLRSATGTGKAIVIYGIKQA